MKTDTKVLIGIILVSASAFLIICLVTIQPILVIYNAEETIRIDSNISENSSINIHICKHTWKSDWYMLYYTIKIPDYVCSEREKENFPWKCEDIHYEYNSGYVWFNTKTKELHQPDIWK